MEQITRRQALTIAAATAAACACCGEANAQDNPGGGGGNNNQPKGPPPKEINIGKLADYPKPGFYDKHVTSQIMIANVDNQLVAMSARCTHKGCILKVKPNPEDPEHKNAQPLMLKCPCHKAEFAEHGQVSTGQAKRSLDRYALKAGTDGNIIVDTTKVFPEKEWEKEGAFITIPKA